MKNNRQFPSGRNRRTNFRQSRKYDNARDLDVPRASRSDTSEISPNRSSSEQNPVVLDKETKLSVPEDEIFTMPFLNSHRGISSSHKPLPFSEHFKNSLVDELTQKWVEKLKSIKYTKNEEASEQNEREQQRSLFADNNSLTFSGDSQLISTAAPSQPLQLPAPTNTFGQPAYFGPVDQTAIWSPRNPIPQFPLVFPQPIMFPAIPADFQTNPNQNAAGGFIYLPAGQPFPDFLPN